jgi:hypothetical protein
MSLLLSSCVLKTSCEAEDNRLKYGILLNKCNLVLFILK